MPFDIEHLTRAVKTQLETVMAAQLDAVEAEWAAIDPLTLPDVVTWYYGHKPTVLELPSASFPFVSTIPARRATVRTNYGWGYQDQNQVVYVDWFVVAADETTADKLCSRYAQAVLAAVQAQRSYYGYDQVDFEPGIELSEASRHPKTAAANMFNDAEVDFIKMGRMTLEFGGNG